MTRKTKQGKTSKCLDGQQVVLNRRLVAMQNLSQTAKCHLNNNHYPTDNNKSIKSSNVNQFQRTLRGDQKNV
eukprot:3035454-Amphidinium_carterae.1